MSDVYQPCRVLKCRKHPPCRELLQTVCIFLSTGVQTTYLYCGGGSLQECSGSAGASEPILGGQRWERCRKGKPTHSVLRSLKNKQNLLHQPLAQTISWFFTYSAKNSAACWLICHFTVHGLSWLCICKLACFKDFKSLNIINAYFSVHISICCSLLSTRLRGQFRCVYLLSNQFVCFSKCTETLLWPRGSDVLLFLTYPAALEVCFE